MHIVHYNVNFTEAIFFLNNTGFPATKYIYKIEI